MPIAHTLKTLILDAVAHQHTLAERQTAEAQAIRERKEAEQHARAAAQKLLDQLRKQPGNKSTLRVVELDGRAFLLNTNASPHDGVVTELAPIEREGSQ